MEISDDFLDKPVDQWNQLCSYQSAIILIKETIPPVNDIVERAIGTTVKAIGNARVRKDTDDDGRLCNLFISKYAEASFAEFSTNVNKSGNSMLGQSREVETSLTLSDR